MIKITRGTINDVVVTLYEKTTIAVDDVHYLFQFTKFDANESTYCIPTDTSDYINRYNEFEILETDSPDPLAGEVSLQEGRYYYYVYEQESTTNLDPSGLTLVESGIVTVYEAPAADDVYQSTSPTYDIYEPGV